MLTKKTYFIVEMLLENRICIVVYLKICLLLVWILSLFFERLFSLSESSLAVLFATKQNVIFNK